MKALGTHLLVEFHGCPYGVLDDLDLVANAMIEAAEEAGATVVTSAFHPFSPQGVSGVVVIAESHLSIHTWPEYGYAAVDFFTCGDRTDPHRARSFLEQVFRAEEVEVLEVKRGQLERRPSHSIPYPQAGLARGAEA